MAYKRRKTKNVSGETKKKMGKIKHIKTTVDEIVFDSKMESKYYEYLKELKKDGIVKDFSLQPEYILQDKFIIVDGKVIEGSHPDFNKLKRKTKAPTVQAIKYRADFYVEYTDGHVEVVDTKGIETADFKIKKKMLLFKYPHLDFKVLTLSGNEWIPYDVFIKNKRALKKQKN